MTTVNTPRYFTPDGQIDWEFISHMRLGLYPDKTADEHQVLWAYFQGGQAGVVRHLEKIGEIMVIRQGTTNGEAYTVYLDGRYQQRSANGRGRKTHTQRR